MENRTRGRGLDCGRVLDVGVGVMCEEREGEGGGGGGGGVCVEGGVWKGGGGGGGVAWEREGLECEV